MITYLTTKRSFLLAVSAGTIADDVADALDGACPDEAVDRSGAEYRSWEKSLRFVAKALADDRIPDDCGVAVELTVSLSGERADCVISGYGDGGNQTAVLIELKQWSNDRVSRNRLSGLLSVTIAGELHREIHPSEKASCYAQSLRDYNAYVQDTPVDLVPCSFAHNYNRAEGGSLFDDCYDGWLKKAPLFCSGEETQLADFIAIHISQGDGGVILRSVGGSAFKYSEGLRARVADVAHGNAAFQLMGDEPVAYEQALECARLARKEGRKRVLVIKGGPGTGKSVVALNLLAHFINRRVPALYVTQTKAPRDVYSRALSGEPGSVLQDSMVWSGNFPKALKTLGIGSCPCTVVDEAHRLRGGKNGVSDVMSIISGSDCTVFMVDKDQTVSFGDADISREIDEACEKLGIEVEDAQLDLQFRCHGSRAYLEFVDRLLYGDGWAEVSVPSDLDYDFQVFDDPADLDRSIRERDQGDCEARLVAGYCWAWNRGSRNNPGSKDISIGDWEASWNLKDGVFACESGSIDQVGCVHTVQGLEFDYVGVIIGPDMGLKDGVIVTDPSRRADDDFTIPSEVKGRNLATTASKDRLKADRVIRNTYRVLLTRGMRGCYVYCCDAALGKRLKELSGLFNQKAEG